MQFTLTRFGDSYTVDLGTPEGRIVHDLYKDYRAFRKLFGISCLVNIVVSLLVWLDVIG